MTPDNAGDQLVAYWLETADEAMASARSEQQAGRHRFVINRCYFACFYAVSAVLLRQGKTFTTHAALRQAVHEELVRPSRISEDLGRLYDSLLASWQEADFDPVARILAADATEAVRGAADFVAEMKRLAAQ